MLAPQSPLAAFSCAQLAIAVAKAFRSVWARFRELRLNPAHDIAHLLSFRLSVCFLDDPLFVASSLVCFVALQQLPIVILDHLDARAHVL